MINMALTFNGYDLSPLLSTLSVSHNVEAAKSMTALDGEEFVASRRRVVIDFSLRPLTDAQLSAVYTALSAINGNATFTDPQTNQTQTLPVRVASNIDAVFALTSVNRKRYYKGTNITLRQRTAWA